MAATESSIIKAIDTDRTSWIEDRSTIVVHFPAMMTGQDTNLIGIRCIEMVFEIEQIVTFTTNSSVCEDTSCFLEAICKELDCQPGDILEYREDE